MHISFDHLRSFFYSVKLGSLRKASSYMNMSLSAVSNQIMLLEKELSLNLMVRNKAGVRLTLEGRKLFNMIKDHVPALNIIPEYYQQRAEAKGDIVLDTWGGIASYGIANHLTNFLEQYQDIRVIIKCHNSDTSFEEWLGDVYIRPYIPHRPDLQQQKLFTVQFHVYASKFYLDKNGCPSEYEDLNKHRLISAYDSSEEILKDTDWHLTIGTDVKRKPALVVNSSVAILEAIQNNAGIGAIPDYYNPEKYGLIKLLPQYEPPAIDFYFITPVYLENLKKIQLLGAYLSRVLSREAID